MAFLECDQGGVALPVRRARPTWQSWTPLVASGHGADSPPPRDLAWALLPWTKAMEAAVLSLLQHKDAAGLPRGVDRPERLDRLTEAAKAELTRQVLETQAFWPGAADEGNRVAAGTVLPARLVQPHCHAEYDWLQFPAEPGVQNPLGFYILAAAQQPAHLSRHGIRYGG